MRVRTFLIVIVLGLFVGAIAGAIWRPRSEETGRVQKARYDEFDYTLAKSPKSAAYNIRLKAKAVSAGARARLLLDHQDQSNYYYVELTDQSVQIGRAEAGIEHALSRAVPPGLPRNRAADIVVKKRRTGIAVVIDGRAVVRAEDDTFASGKIGFGALSVTESEAKSVELTDRIRRQRIGDLYFSDDFMRAHTDECEWEPLAGTWTINTLDNPSLSSNAFSYLGKAASRGLSLVGEWFWDDYSLQAACYPKGTGSFGLCFYYRNENDYFLFKWDCATQPDARASLIHCINGQDHVVAETPSGFSSGQWYTARVEVSGETARAYVDGHLLVEARSDALSFGRAGLYTEDASGTDFDDVLTERVRAFRDDFARHVPGRWSERGGKWLVLETPGRVPAERVLAVRSDDMLRPAKVVAGDVSWRRYALSVEATPRGQGRIGLCFCYLDDANYYIFDWNARTGERRLLKMADGVQTPLAETSGAPPSQESPSKIAVVIDDGHIMAWADGDPACEAWDTALHRGKIGLWADGCPQASFDNVCVSFLPARHPLAAIHEVFSHEVSMQVWSGEQSDWRTEKELLLGEEREVQWHRADFRGDVELEVRVERLAKAKDEIGLIVGANPEDKNQGYWLSIRWPTATFFCDGKMVGRTDIEEVADFTAFRLRRVGRHAVVLRNGRVVFTCKNTVAGAGSKLGFYANGVEIKRDDVNIYTNNVLNYAFTRATSDWRVAAGVWEVTNRWQCDPRWSFFSGAANTPADSRNLAAIWNKRLFRGDVTVECYAGIKMDRSRGNRYEYAADINLTLCADGKDLTSGYNFLFAGWDNTKTCITKGSQVVAWTEDDDHLIKRSSSIHRHWFHLRAEKVKNRLRFWVEGKLAAEYTDPSPLTGSRIAIWTWNNGIMLARLRISCEGAMDLETPAAFAERACRSVYDAPENASGQTGTHRH